MSGEAAVQGLLLQAMTETMIIERDGDNGFRGGGFMALFRSIELDQVRRGVLPAKG